jgi:hypothetical protein
MSTGSVMEALSLCQDGWCKQNNELWVLLPSLYTIPSAREEAGTGKRLSIASKSEDRKPVHGQFERTFELETRCLNHTMIHDDDF